jgi:hypothetical protein
MSKYFLFPASRNILFFLFVSCFVIGCKPQGPEVFSVEGIVTLDGKPFDFVTITFTPRETGRMGFATTNAEGKFKLSTIGAKPETGTTFGEYSVSFNKEVLIKPPPSEKTKQLVPKKYLSPETSDFNVSVENRKNVFNFELKSK